MRQWHVPECVVSEHVVADRSVQLDLHRDEHQGLLVPRRPAQHSMFQRDDDKLDDDANVDDDNDDGE